MTDMAVTGVNDQLFVDVLVQIEREPEKWCQASFMRRTPCGTAYCFAGWADVLSVGRWMGCAEDTCGRLGIEYGAILHDDTCLFQGDNSMDDLYRISADLMGIDVEVLREKVQASL